MGLDQAMKLLHFKENTQQLKRQPRKSGKNAKRDLIKD